MGQTNPCSPTRRCHKNQLFRPPPLCTVPQGDVRGPIDLLKETWKTSPKSDECFVSMLVMMERYGGKEVG